MYAGLVGLGIRKEIHATHLKPVTSAMWGVMHTQYVGRISKCAGPVEPGVIAKQPVGKDD